LKEHGRKPKEEASTMNRYLMGATIVIASFALLSTAHSAGDAAAGKTKSARCVACHGAEGQGVPPNPALAGKPEAEQVKALQEYKSGSRANPVMKAMATPLSDQDIEDLSAYYASLK
jgi:cytochrome c553